MLPDNPGFILLAVDTSGIQSFIFGSNRLKENIGASYLVKQATEDWAFQALKEVASKNNLGDKNKLDVGKEIVAHKLDAEVIYAGGGNFVALFRTTAAAKDFTRKLSTEVLLKAPGLRLDIYQEPFEWAETGLSQAVRNLLGNMKMARGKKPISTPLLGLGVTVMCQSTALPAVEAIPSRETNEQFVYVSAEIAAKQEAAKLANNWLSNELPPGIGFDYPQDLDNLGRSPGENSYVAVVHADGNGMGEIISDIGKIDDNRDYICEMRKFSEQVKAISTQAMMKVIELLQKNVDNEKTPKEIPGSNSVTALKLAAGAKGSHCLPIRPLVFGGDDTTFVCDGRIGLSLATAYLEAFEQAAQAQEKGRKLSACAGIAIVKAHYPFARAYQLAEELCAEAKKFRWKRFPKGGGALDWYFSAGGLYDNLENMREREYTVREEGSLTLRPVSLGSEGEASSWSEIKRVTNEFDSGWAEKRNKAKALRDALRAGPEAVKRSIHIYGNDLPGYGPFSQTGWHDKRCGYFDALELMDIFIDLN